MNCKPTNVPAADEIDIPALREKYRQERDKRLNARGQGQYVQVAREFHDLYATDPHKPVAPREPVSEEIDVAILGGGFGGILAAYHLGVAGVTNFRNIDHAGDFGGVWYWNRYPGIQCDNDAYCYLPLLEETGYMPSKRFADGGEIHEYCRLIARKYGFAERALFHTLITALRWDETIGRWRVSTNRGDEIRARFVVMACGVLNMPKLPGIAGIEQFKGTMFHSSRWTTAIRWRYAQPGARQAGRQARGDRRHGCHRRAGGTVSRQICPAALRVAAHAFERDERPNPPTDPAWVRTLQPGWQKERQENFQRAVMEFPLPGEPDLVCDLWTEISRNLSAALQAEGGPSSRPRRSRRDAKWWTTR